MELSLQIGLQVLVCSEFVRDSRLVLAYGRVVIGVRPPPAISKLHIVHSVHKMVECDAPPLAGPPREREGGRNSEERGIPIFRSKRPNSGPLTRPKN